MRLQEVEYRRPNGEVLYRFVAVPGLTYEPDPNAARELARMEYEIWGRWFHDGIPGEWSKAGP